MKTYPVTVLCRIMKVNPSGFYAWAKQPDPAAKPMAKKIEARVISLFSESHASFGSRRLSKHLKDTGYSVGRFKARTLMNKLSLVVRRKGQYVVTTDSKHNKKIAENLLDRKFNPEKPDQVWTTDITYLKSQRG